jgi:hypothetical protein
MLPQKGDATMRWTLTVVLGLAVVGLAGCSGVCNDEASVPVIAQGGGEPVLTYELPHDVDLAQKMPQQADFDLYSWKEFVALNWPANADGTPNKKVKIGEESKARRVWEFYMDPGDVFLPDGSKPVWKVRQDLGAGLNMIKGAGQAKGRILDALHFPVVDQDKNFIVFGIRLNKDEFDYIAANGLYSKKGQQGPTIRDEKFISFPAGAKDGAVGAVEIKTAWRIFPPDPKPDPEILKRYFTTQAVLTIPKENSATGKELNIPAMLGLVGFHIAHKTKSFPQWVWSTFEHVDNLTAPAGKKPTFRDPDCDEMKCPPNSRPVPPGVAVPAKPEEPEEAPFKPYLWSDKAPFAGPNQRIPVQVKRLAKITDDTVKLNESWQKALRAVDADSMWQNYQLISTQWPLKPFARQPGQLPGAGGTNPTVSVYEGSPVPTLLANIPIEVYNQDTSSCIKCHSKATTTNGDYADFSYLLQFAK